VRRKVRTKMRTVFEAKSRKKVRTKKRPKVRTVFVTKGRKKGGNLVRIVLKEKVRPRAGRR
jgi:hypothetical protein